VERATIKDIIVESIRRYKPSLIGLFGSYARNEHREDSDIDILVSFKDSISLLGLIQLENELTEKLGKKVDLVTEGAIVNERLRSNIFTDLQIIFQA